MNFPLYIAKRYLKSASKNNAINIINGIASLGIIVGAMALFVVLSVFSGLKDFSLSFSNNSDPDLKVSSTLGKSFYVSAEQNEKLQKINGIAASSKILEDRVLFMFDGKEIVTYLKGVDASYGKVNDVKKTIFQGDWLEPNTTQVVVGYGISQKLSLGLFEFNHPFEVFVPRPGKGAIENPEQAFNKTTIAPVGIYAISEDLDSKYVYADLGLTQNLLEYKSNQISAIELKLKPNSDEEIIKKELQSIFNKKVTVKNRAELNASLHRMLNTENLILYLIFTLVIIMVLFAFSGAIFIMILDKKENLKTLYHIGCQHQKLRKIFLFQGIISSSLAGLIGIFIGSIIVFLQQFFSLIMITPTLAYPVVFSIQNVLIVFATIVLLGFIASFIASSRVTKKLLN